MAQVVRTRVDEKDAPPLELSLLLTEVARLDARRALIRGRVDADLITIAQLIGAPQDSLTGTIGRSARYRTGPEDSGGRYRRGPGAAGGRDCRQAERGSCRSWYSTGGRREVARYHSVRCVQNQSWLSELPAPLTAIPDTDHVVAFGASIGLPFFNTNQGARAEAAVAVRQARLRRELTEQTVRAEVTSAFRRAEAAQTALTLFEQGVLNRSDDNIRIMRAAYELGEFRITDVITEQRRVLEAQQEYTEALAERYRALIDLRAAIGLAGLQP